MVRVFLSILAVVISGLTATQASAQVSQQGELATTRPAGSTILGDPEAEARVRRSEWEPRPGNTPTNHTVPRAEQLQRFYEASSWGECGDGIRYRVTGQFTGTTDEILQWAAHKWGFEEDLLRAVAVVESWWRHTAGDEGGGGLMSVTEGNSTGAYPMYRQSTAFNVDYFAATLRYYYDGCGTWLDEVDRGRDYSAGDLWGSLGAWYSGRWYANGTDWYIDRVWSELQSRTWERPGF